MGKIQIDHTGSGGGITLSSDGTSLLVGGSAVGGADLYAANESSPNAQPSATGTNAIAIGDRAVATREDSLAVGTDTDATGDVSTALGAGAQATGDYSLAVGLNATSSGARAVGIGNNGVVAGSTYSTAIGHTSGGGGSVTATGAGAMALGGSRASGVDSLAAVVNNNTSSYGALGANTIAMGQRAKASDGTSIAIGQDVTSANGSVAIGLDNTASATGSAAFGNNATAAGVRSTALTYSHAGGTMSFAAAIGNSSSGRGAQAANAVAIGSNAYVQATESIGLGYYATIASGGLRAVALGKSYVSGNTGLAAVIDNNTSSYGALSDNSVAIGYQAKAYSTDAIAIGDNAQAGQARAYALGANSTVTGHAGVVLGGSNNSATATYSTAINGYNATSDVMGKVVFGTAYVNWTRGPQSGIHTLFADTTNATATEIRAQNESGAVKLPDNSAYAFHGTIVAREKASEGTDCAAWKIEGLIRREGSAGTTVLVNSATTVLNNAPNWVMALSADTTNGSLKIEGTGAASTNVRWVATIHTSEVTYA